MLPPALGEHTDSGRPRKPQRLRGSVGRQTEEHGGDGERDERGEEAAHHATGAAAVRRGGQGERCPQEGGEGAGTMSHWVAPVFVGRKRKAGYGDDGFVRIVPVCIHCRAFVDVHYALFSLVKLGRKPVPGA